MKIATLTARVGLPFLMLALPLRAEEAPAHVKPLARFADPLPTLQGLPEGFAMSPGGRKIAASWRGDGQYFCLMDTETFKLDQIKGWGPVFAFSADGAILAAGNNGAGVVLYDTSTAKELLHFEMENKYEPIRGLAFSPDGKCLAVSAGKQLLRFVDPATGRDIGHAIVEACEPGCLAFSADGRRLAATVLSPKDGKPSIAILDPHSFKVVTQIAGAGTAKALALSADSSRLASRNESGVLIFDAASGEKCAMFESEATQFESRLCFGPGGKTLVQSDYSLTVIRDLESGKPLHTIETHGTTPVTDGTTLQFLTSSGRLTIMDITGEPASRRRAAHQSSIQGLAFSPDGKVLASCALQDEAILWDVAGRKFLKRLPISSGEVKWTPEGRLVAAGLVFDGAFEKSEAIPGGTEWAASPDRKFAVSPTATPGVIGVDLIEVDSRKVLKTLAFPGTSGLFAAAFSPDSKRVALTISSVTVPCGNGLSEEDMKKLEEAARPCQEVPVVDSKTGEILFVLKGHTSDVVAVKYAPDGKRIATGSLDGTVRTWDAATGRPLLTIHVAEKAYLRDLAFSRDGRVATTEESVVRVYDLSTGARLAEFAGGHQGDVTAVAFSADDRLLASGGEDGAIVLWDVAPK